MLYVLIYSMLSTTSWIPAHLTAMCLFMLSLIHSSPDKCTASLLIFSWNFKFLKHPGTGKACVLFSLGSQTPYYEKTDVRNMELDKIANEKFNEYIAREFKPGHNNFPSA